MCKNQFQDNWIAFMYKSYGLYYVSILFCFIFFNVLLKFSSGINNCIAKASSGYHSKYFFRFFVVEKEKKNIIECHFSDVALQAFPTICRLNAIIIAYKLHVADYDITKATGSFYALKVRSSSIKIFRKF